MAGKTVTSDLSLGVAVDAKTHIDSFNRLDPGHRLYRTMTSLTRNFGVNVNAMTEPNE